MPAERGLSTRCIHSGEAPDPLTGAHGVPLYANVTYAFRSFEQIEATQRGELPHFTYSPRGNPTVRCFELKMADLEGAEAAVAGASGMAVVGAVLHALAAGGHLVASGDIYELSRRFLEQELPTCGGSVSFVDAGDVEAISAAIGPETRVVYVEPFSNPLMRVADLPAIATVAHAAGALLVVDNTFLSPALLRPLERGADVVLHSATKYLSGHGQIQGGVAAGPRSLVERIKERLIVTGGAMPPFAAWLLLAGIKTLPLRMERHSRNAAALARLLAEHPSVASVNYPGFGDGADHATAKRLLGRDGDAFGGMLSFTLRGERPARAAFVNALEIPALAVSLGDCGTLVWPWSTSDLIRVSVGLEDEADLLADFSQALDRAAAVSG